MALYDTVRDLPLLVEGYTLDGHEYVISPTFTRKTTVIGLTGGGEVGLGEDVTYDAAEHDAQQARGPVLPLAGEWTIDGFSHHLETLPLFASAPERDVYVDYRRWAFESAALDLALRQAGRSLGETVGREARPVAFVASGGLGDPPSTARLRSFLALYPGLRFKLDARPDWTDEIFDELRALECVDSIDLKGQYTGTVVDNPPDPELYRRVLEAFPDAWIEDPALTPETEALLEPHADRVTWDAVIHSVADIEALRWPPARSTSSRPGSARSSGCSPRTSTARPAGSAHTGAVNGSSRSDAGTSSSWQRSSTPTRRTTSLPAATTRRSHRPACRRARSPSRLAQRGSSSTRVERRGQIDHRPQ